MAVPGRGSGSAAHPGAASRSSTSPPTTACTASSRTWWSMSPNPATTPTRTAMDNHTEAEAIRTVRYRVTGMDCSSCAAKIEGATRRIEGVGEVKVSIATQVMTLRVGNSETALPKVEDTVTGLGYRLDRIGAQQEAASAPAASAPAD